MLEINDFWKIWNIVDGTDETSSSDILVSLAKSEKGNTKNLFENKLDQAIYASDDYKRIRQMIMDWYATHKTLTTVQRKYPDPYSLEDTLLDELFKSFGFNFSANIVTKGTSINHNKINFLLDLVKLYRIKGTPESILGSLKYYGFNDIDLVEYFLRRSPTTGELIFESQIILSTGQTGTTLLKKFVDYNTLIEGDPHWLTSKEKCEQLFATNKIALPSKSPYFSLRAAIKNEDILTLIAYLNKVIKSQYDLCFTDGVYNGNKPPLDANISLTNTNVSLLELWLATQYVLFSYYSKSVGYTPSDKTKTNFDGLILPISSDETYTIYDGTNTTSTEIIDEHKYYTDYLFKWDDILTGGHPRNDRKILLNSFNNIFSNPKSEDFLQTQEDTKNILTQINSQLISDLDLILDITPAIYLISPFLKDIDTWVRKNVSDAFPKLSYFCYGSDTILQDVESVINFFKPYRSRCRTIEVIFLQDNRLTESVVMEDFVIDKVKDNIIEPVYIEDEDYLTIRENITDKLSCTIIRDIIISEISDVDKFITTSDYLPQAKDLDSGSQGHFINIYGDIRYTGTYVVKNISTIDSTTVEVQVLLSDNSTSPSWIPGIPYLTYYNNYSPLSNNFVVSGDMLSIGNNTINVNGGFVDFDEDGAVYDCTYANDTCVIKVIELGDSILYDTFTS